MSSQISSPDLLPPGFEDLHRFVDKWAKPTTNERFAARAESDMDEIVEFYEAMVARADEAMTLIDSHDLHSLPPDVGRLCQLVLALCQASVAVEILREPYFKGAPYPSSVRVARGAPPYGG